MTRDIRAVIEDIERDKGNIETTKAALIEFLNNQENRTIYHLTITYKKRSETRHTANVVENYFKNFYLKDFLPYLMNTKHYNRNSKRNTQPICIAFLDEHLLPKTNISVNENPRFTSRGSNDCIKLHHHAVIAVHDSHVNMINSLINPETNKAINELPINNSQNIMTTCIARRDANIIGYAAKKLKTYPDFLSFPDRLAPK